ncbi:MAG: exonuclease SbcD [Candidatus Woesearchaeota archaeon]|jgi:exonuclease SbcD
MLLLNTIKTASYLYPTHISRYMKFSHIADCHLGSYREPALRQLGLESFAYAIEESLKAQVDFIIIAGDLFNNALPSIETLKETVKILNKPKQQNIPVYIVAGSHDYSPAGKTMLHILEETQLAINVMQGEVSDNILTLKPIIDQKTGIHLYGLLGRADGLESTHFEMLNKDPIEKDPAQKIFLFHTTITEFKPVALAQAKSIDLSLFPKNCLYYAGGHVHMRKIEDVENYGRIVYPGPTFPNNFGEIEKLHCGSFVINTLVDNKITSDHKLIKLTPHIHITLDITNKSKEKIIEELATYTVKDSVVTLRIKGHTTKAELQAMELSKSLELLQEAKCILKNSSKLDIAELQIAHSVSADDEEKVIGEHLGQFKMPKEKELVDTMMRVLDTQKEDGEKNHDFHNRIIEEFEESQE